MQLIINENKQKLEDLEAVINQNLQSFIETGRALTEIRDKELYKLKNNGKYQTFGAYCKDIWDISRPRAYQLIDAAKVQENLSTIVDKLIPEGQTRPLAKLEPEKQREAWQKAKDAAPEGKVTALHLAKVVKEMIGEVKKEQPKKEKGEEQQSELKGHTPEHAIHFADIAISHLSRINDDNPFREEAFTKVEDWINTQRASKKMSAPQVPGFPNAELEFPVVN